jgi:hypothetical protein
MPPRRADTPQKGRRHGRRVQLRGPDVAVSEPRGFTRGKEERSERRERTPRFLPAPPGRTERKGRHLPSAFVQVEAIYTLGP